MAGAYSSAYSSAYDIGAGGGFLAAWAIGSNVQIELGAMLKNVASQKVGAQLVSASDGSAFTGAVTVAVTVDAGTQATGSVGSGACAHEGGGYHTYSPAQAETNGDLIAFTFSGTGAIPVTVQVYTLPATGILAPTTAGRTLDVSAGGEAGVDWANVGSPTTSLNLSGTTIAITQKVDLETIKTQTVTCAGGVTVPAATLASTTNITAGTITTATNLTNAPSAGDFTATMKTSIGTAVAASAVASVTGNVGGNVTGSIGSLAAQAKLDVNAEVLDVLNTDTFAEPGQEAPGATISLVKKIGYLYKAWRNKKTQTSSAYNLLADDATTVDQKATVSDDGTTTTVGEVASGP